LGPTCNVTEKASIPYVVMASVSERNEREMIKLAIQLMQVVVEVPVLRAHSGYISELIVHGIGPIPAVHQLVIVKNHTTICCLLIRTNFNNYVCDSLNY